MRTWFRIVTVVCSLGIAVIGLTTCDGVDRSAGREHGPVLPRESSLNPPLREGGRKIGEYIVSPGSGVSPEPFKKAVLEGLKDFEPSILEEMGEGNILIRVGKDPGPKAMEEAVKRVPGIRAIQPNFIYRAITWNRKKVDAHVWQDTWRRGQFRPQLNTGDGK